MSKKKVPPPISVQDFPIVGIGASAGGLDAFKRFLRAIPADSGMAYVLVQHLDPKHPSILPEILSKVTDIPVNKITDDIHLAPDHIYVIPENKTLTSVDGVLKLTPRSKIAPNLPIDVFFTSLAEVHLSFAVGVVLSGTGKDGTKGLESIKAHGGMTFAQDEESSAYEAMPQNAVNADVVDFILPPEDIPPQLLKLTQIIKERNGLADQKSSGNEMIFKQILFLLRQRSGVDFNNYKQTTIRRRIVRRMAINKEEKLADYLRLLRKNKTEQDALFHDMLIPVTAFFRDPELFQVISDRVFPAILKDKSSVSPIRIWVAGCSTGQEAYSLAIALNESAETSISRRQIQIFSSDISEAGISKARTGIYQKEELRNVSADFLKKYFKINGEAYQVIAQIRDMCIFAVHDFLKDPPFAKMDLITCRNVFIYMDTYLQKKALSLFHYALNDAGFLFLGKTETTGPASDLFTTISKKDKIYLKNAGANRLIPTFAVRGDPSQFKNKPKGKLEVLPTDFKKLAEISLLSAFTPAGVVVNEQMDIVYIHGSIAPYLEQTEGRPSLNLIKMAREGLAFELRNTMHKAKSTQSSVIKKGIPVKINNREYLVSIQILPLPGTIDSHFLICFRKHLLKNSRTGFNENANAPKINPRETSLRIALERELAQTREDMRSITEDQEAANEELQSANEELLSSSEELQSLNEELETSKEETQSSNEELIIVNQELLDKQEQIDLTRRYAESIIHTIREPLAVLDKSLAIKGLNPAFEKKFGLLEADAEGKTIFEVKSKLFDHSEFRTLLEQVLPLKSEMNDFELTIHLPTIGERKLSLSARQILNGKSKDDLILLAIEDITERKITEQKKEDFSNELQSQVKEASVKLKRTSLQVDQFIHSTSHEFQEPLRKIITLSKLLQEDTILDDPKKTKKLLSKIEAASVRMAKLIQETLNFAGVINYEKSFIKTDLSEVLKNVLSDFELLIAEKKASITFNELPDIDAVPFQMNQLFYDLIHNALKFSKAGVRPIIHISSNSVSKEKMKSHPHLNSKLHYIEIIFKDNGIGFNQKYEEKIFSMFQRLNVEGNYGGTGIGLAICKNIVESYSGEIFAEGVEQGGAVFHVMLPIDHPRKTS
jgi:two-component system CheB/CheR fusion protein